MDRDLSDSAVKLDVVVVCVTVLVAFGRPSFSGSETDRSLSDSTYCRGSKTAGSDMLVASAVARELMGFGSFSWSVVAMATCGWGWRGLLTGGN